MDFSENLSHAIIRGLCNRAEGGREGSDKKGRLSSMVGERWELGCLQSWSWLQREGWGCISSHRQHNQWQKRSSGALDLCKEDDNEPQDLAACPVSTAASWGVWAGAEERQDKGLLHCNPQCWERILNPGPHLEWDMGRGGCILSHLHVRPRGPGLIRTQRMMTLGVKNRSLSSKLLGNYFPVWNCKENTQPFNLR